MGDLILLESGSKIPADLRLVQTQDLFVNESLLTGESIDVKKEANFLSDKNELPVADRINMAYAGFFVSQGRAKGVVIAIALDTQIGKIAELLASSSSQKVPLIIRMERFSVFYWVLSMDYSEESARNITLLLMVLFENVHVFNSRSEKYSIFKIEHRKNLLLLFSVFFTQVIHFTFLLCRTFYISNQSQ